MNKRQEFAITYPYDYLAHKMLPGYHRDIGKFSTLLTVDSRPDFPDMCDGLPEWHASAGLVSSRVIKEMGPLRAIYDRGNLPMVNMLLWSEKAWGIAINFCKVMLRDVGAGQGYWTGEGASLHYRKKLTPDELMMCSPLVLKK
jgi:hypothetical protein